MADLIDLTTEVATLASVGRLKVSRLAKQQSGSEAAQEALYSVAAGQRISWDTESWNKLLRRLDRSPLKVEDWLLIHG